MPTIEIDFDVFKAITNRRPSEETTENDVLREVFGLPPKKGNYLNVLAPEAGDWVTKGIRFPAGTEFRANYKGRTHLARNIGRIGQGTRAREREHREGGSARCELEQRARRGDDPVHGGGGLARWFHARIPLTTWPATSVRR